MQGIPLVGKLLELYEHRKKYILPLILMTLMPLKLKILFLADPCHHYSKMSEAHRNVNHQTQESDEELLCDRQLPEVWYRFVGDAGTKMPTTPVPRNRCGTAKSGWLKTAHPSVEDGIVRRKVCFSSISTNCKDFRLIFVKNCGLYYVYELLALSSCPRRYCGTDEK